MGNTPNNNFPFPESTDLVKDGAQAIEDLADAIDTTLGVYAPSAAGLTLINTTSFSGVSSQSVNDVFNATYDNYRIQLNITANAGFSADNLQMRLRVSGADNTSSNYRYAMTQFQAGVEDSLTSTGATAWILHRYIRADGLYGNIEVTNPFTANYTGAQNISLNPNFGGSTGAICFASTTVTTSYTGFTLFPTAGTMTGNVRIYGYNK
jgi:hypothetical protein